MTNDAKLLPCPFCGSVDVEAVDTLDFVACQNCGASLEDSDPSARKLWNTRASPAPAIDREAVRESIIHECIDIVQKFDDCGAVFIVEKLREFALINPERQP